MDKHTMAVVGEATMTGSGDKPARSRVWLWNAGVLLGLALLVYHLLNQSHNHNSKQDLLHLLELRHLVQANSRRLLNLVPVVLNLKWVR